MEFTHTFMYCVTFSSFLQIPPVLARWPEEGSSAPSLLLAISSPVTDMYFTAEDVLLKPVAAPQSTEADPLQSNRLL